MKKLKKPAENNDLTKREFRIFSAIWLVAIPLLFLLSTFLALSHYDSQFNRLVVALSTWALYIWIPFCGIWIAIYVLRASGITAMLMDEK